VFYVVLVIFILVGGALTILIIENFSNEVQLSVFIWQTPSLPLGLLLLGAFLLGALLLYLVAVASAWQSSREVRRLRKRVEELEQASMRAPSAPLPGAAPVVPMPGAAPVVPMPGTPPMVPMPGMPTPEMPTPPQS